MVARWKELQGRQHRLLERIVRELEKEEEATEAIKAPVVVSIHKPKERPRRQ
jgi:electron transfer flavoprotein alpha/beta subunit